MAVTQHRFEANWCAALKRRKDQDKFREYWQATKAVEELKRTGRFDFACNAQAFSAQLVELAQDYEKCRDDVLRINRILKNAGSKLVRVQTEIDGIQRELQRVFPEQTIRPTVDYLSDLSFRLGQDESKLEAELEFIWQVALATDPFGLDASSLDDTIRRSEFGFLKPSELLSIQQNEGPGSQASYMQSRLLPKQVVRKLDLDSTFQIRTAAMLTHVFPRLTKMTRLVVLVCVCAELAELTDPDITDGLRIKGSKSGLSVSGVYQKIKGRDLSGTGASQPSHP